MYWINKSALNGCLSTTNQICAHLTSDSKDWGIVELLVQCEQYSYECQTCFFLENYTVNRNIVVQKINLKHLKVTLFCSIHLNNEFQSFGMVTFYYPCHHPSPYAGDERLLLCGHCGPFGILRSNTLFGGCRFSQTSCRTIRRRTPRFWTR